MMRTYIRALKCLLLTLQISIAALAQKPVKIEAVPFSVWKFKTGDDNRWIDPGFDDKNWPVLNVPGTWESQGYDRYDGKGCYRSHIVIPSYMFQKDSAGLNFEMGAIDDMDSVYLNGSFIGATRIFTEKRNYFVHYNSGLIKWDQENVVVVKVTDETGWGGMYKGKPQVSVTGRNSFIDMQVNSGQWQINAQNAIEKEVRLTAKAKMSLSGKFRVSLENPWSGQSVLLSDQQVSFSDSHPFLFHFQVTLPDSNAYFLKYSFHEEGRPDPLIRQEYLPYILTPAAPETPRLGGAKVIGVRPGSKVLYRIPVTGLRPMTFKAEDLPSGLFLDTISGIITGTLPAEGTYKIGILVSNYKGLTRAAITLRVGESISLTPPMGWNSWNVWGVKVDQQKILNAGRSLIDHGLADYGWSYINIDDGWQGRRNKNGKMIPSANFPSMPGLVKQLHDMGLKVGIYSSPGPLTCGNFPGSMNYEHNDVQTWVNWDIDYLKYDWCSYGGAVSVKGQEDLKHPYSKVSRLLSASKRDIVLSLCQYGIGDVWKWGKDAGGQLWRTGGDITDTWRSIEELGFQNKDKAPFAGPGGWNDMDMLVVGSLGWGEIRPSKLTPDEQYSHVSLWAIQAAPLMISCDLTNLDPFTRNLLCNNEVIAVNQDQMGIQGTEIYSKGGLRIYKKQLEENAHALAIFNTNDGAMEVGLSEDMFGIKGPRKIRDIWRQKDLGYLHDLTAVKIPPHGVVLLRLETL